MWAIEGCESTQRNTSDQIETPEHWKKEMAGGGRGSVLVE